jgi:hypothetical protein
MIFTYGNSPVLYRMRSVDFDMVLIQPKIPCGLKINPMFRLVGKTFIDIPFKFHTLIIHILNIISNCNWGQVIFSAVV